MHLTHTYDINMVLNHIRFSMMYENINEMTTKKSTLRFIVHSYVPSGDFVESGLFQSMSNIVYTLMTVP